MHFNLQHAEFLAVKFQMFIAGSRPCSERFLSGYSVFPLSSKTNIFKFQFDLDYCQALCNEPLAREIAQALPVLLTSNKFVTSVFLKQDCFAPIRENYNT